MKVVVIKDEDARALVEKLELERLKLRESYSGGLSPDKEQMIEKLHRAFHYHVVSWLQDQGCKLI